MLGTIVNSAAVIVGALIGLLLGRALPVKLGDTIMKGLGLCVLYIGISGALKGSNTIVLIISIVLGALIGELADLDGKLRKLGEFFEARFGKHSSGEPDSSNPGEEKKSIAQGFVSASLLFCVGAMAIVGSLQSGLTGDHTTIYLKSALDFTAAIIFASQLGAGVILSSGFVFVYQGAIVLLARWISPFLSDAVIAEMTCAGSVLIIGLALNMLGITKLKVMNYVPAIFVAAAAQAVFALF
jgi:Uncharacterized membrane protein, possible Na+ channel or pump